MFNPFGALTGLAGGAIKGYTEDYPKIVEQLGSQAWGRALSVPGEQPMPPIQLGSQQTPEPGQPSVRGGPQLATPIPQGAQAGGTPPMPEGAGGSMFGGMPGWSPGERPIEMGAQPVSLGRPPPPPAGATPAPGVASAAGPSGSPTPVALRSPPQATGGQTVPLMDLNTAVARIRAANPGIRPDVMAAALNKALPSITEQGRMQLAQLQQQSLDQNRTETQRLAREKLAQDERFNQFQMGESADAEADAKATAKDIVDGIEKGTVAPTAVGYGKYRAMVAAEAARRGVNMPERMLEYKRAERMVTSLNAPRMVQFQGLATAVDKTIDRVRDLSEQLALSGIPKLNHLELMKLVQLQGNTPQGQLAQQYVTAINTLKEEFAGLANGGYAPTESVWKLANRQLSEDFGVKQMGATLDEIQRLIRYRVNAIPGLSQAGPGASNRYLGTQQNQTPAPTTGGLAPGWSVQEVK